MALSVITKEQLKSVATAQKSYIDSKDAAAKTYTDGQIASVNSKIPTEASAADLKEITDLFTAN